MVDRRKLLSEERVRLGPAVVEGLRVVRAHAAGVLLLTFLLSLAVEVAFGAIQAGNPDFAQTGALTGMDSLWSITTREWNLPAMVMFLTVVPVVVGAVSVLIVATELGAEPTTGAAVRGALARAGRLLAVSIALAAAMAVVVAFAILVDGLLPSPLPTSDIGNVFSALVLVAGFVLLSGFALAAYPVAAVERGGPIDAVRRTIEVARRPFRVWVGRAFAILLLASIVSAVVRFVVMQIVRGIEKGALVESIGEAVADTVFLPIVAAGAAMTYLDVRGRQDEGLERDGVRADLPL